MDIQQVLESARTFLEWFGLDLTPQTMIKCAILSALVLGLLLVIALLYRGEMQNRDILAVLVEYRSGEKQTEELVFAKRTLDIKTETTAADVAIYANFQVRVGEDVQYIRRRIYGGSMRLRMKAVAAAPLREGHFGIDPERHTRVAKLIAKQLATETERARRRATPFWEQVPIINHLVKLPVKPFEVISNETAIRLSFRIDPIYLLTAHPDREVKTSAWLTLLTSFFAVIMQIMFGGGPDRAAQTPDRPAQVRVVPPSQ